MGDKSVYISGNRFILDPGFCAGRFGFDFFYYQILLTPEGITFSRCIDTTEFSKNLNESIKKVGNGEDMAK